MCIRDRKLLTGNLIKVRNHKKKALGSGVGGRKSTSRQRSVYGTSRTSLGPVSYTHLDVYKRQPIAIIIVLIILAFALYPVIRKIQAKKASAN